MKQAQLFVVLIVFLELLSGVLFVLAAIGPIDIEFSAWELSVSAGVTVAHLFAAILLWNGRRFGWTLTAWLLALSITLTLLDFLSIVAEPGDTGAMGLTFLLFGALLYWLRSYEIRQYCTMIGVRWSRRSHLAWAATAKVSLYGGALLVTAAAINWIVSILAVVVLFILREWIRPRQRVRRTP